MPKDFPRALRVGEQIRRELVSLIRDTVKDPRVKDFAISEVVVSRDLSSAKVYYVPYSGHAETEGLQTGLQSAASFLRKELGKILHVRSVPRLLFVYDDSQERGQRLDKLLAENRLPDDSELDS